MAIARAVSSMSANLYHPVMSLYFPYFNNVPEYIEANVVGADVANDIYTYSVGCGSAAQSCTFPPNFYLIEGPTAAFWANRDANGGSTTVSCAMTRSVDSGYCAYTYNNPRNGINVQNNGNTKLWYATVTVMNVVATASATPTAAATIKAAGATGAPAFSGFSIQSVDGLKQQALTVGGVTNAYVTVQPVTVNVPSQTTSGTASPPTSQASGSGDGQPGHQGDPTTWPGVPSSASKSNAAGPAATGMAGLGGVMAAAAIAAVAL